MKKLFTVLVLAFGAASAAYAQPSASTPAQNVQLVLNNRIDIAINSTGTPQLTFNSTTDYTNGVTQTGAIALQVYSNRGYALTVKANAANFTPSGAGATNMPSSVLQVKESTQSYATLNGTTDVALGTFTRTVGAGGNNGVHAIDLKANPGFSYDADTYTIGVVFTATQQ